MASAAHAHRARRSRANDRKPAHKPSPPYHEEVGRPEGRYWYLPHFLEIPHLYCDFLQVESIPYRQMEEEYEELAVLSPPFAESLQACYGAFHGSVGIPNVMPASVASMMT